MVDAAYEKRSIAISSNLHPSGFDELMPKSLATATVERLLHHAHVLITDGQDSYHSPRRPPARGQPLNYHTTTQSICWWGYSWPPAGETDGRQWGDSSPPLGRMRWPLTAAKEASASLDAISLTRVQMRRGQMPVVVPMESTHGRSEEDGLPKALSIREGDIETLSEDPIPGSEVVVVVPIQNVGSGPALDLRASVEFLDAEGHMSPAGQPLFVRWRLLCARVGSAAALRFRYRGLAVPVLPFRVSLGFFDTYGAGYESAATSFPEAMVYRDFVFRAPAELEPGSPH